MSAFIETISTAVPKFCTPQSKIADFMVNQLELSEEEEHQLRVLYRASGIVSRYSVLEDFGLEGEPHYFKRGQLFPSVQQRMETYQKEASNLAIDAVNGLNRDLTKVTHLITTSCTGMYAPGIDIELIEKLNLSPAIHRTCINFMGCYAAFNALKTSKYIVEADPAASVLIVSVELCTIHFQAKKDEESLLSNAIFGDGAAAVFVGSKPSHKSLSLESFFTDIAFEGKDDMSWKIGNQGFDMRLSAEVPDRIKAGIGTLTERLLDQLSLKREVVRHYAIHPGGKRILEVIEEKLGICKEANKPARSVLRDFGNMSSPTVLFVLKEVMETIRFSDEYVLSFAFGPGLTLESALLKTYL